MISYHFGMHRAGVFLLFLLLVIVLVLVIVRACRAVVLRRRVLLLVIVLTIRVLRDRHGGHGQCSCAHD